MNLDKISISSAKQLHSLSWISPELKLALENDFPELKESEDERIRNLIYCLIRDRSDNRKLLEHNGVSVDDALAYLERQKDANKEYWRGYREGKQEILDKYAEIEKQKEQKPADNVSKEEYVKRFKTLCDTYEIKLPNREYDIYGLCENLHKLFGDIQQPAEWSEEDEKMCIRCIEIFDEILKSGYVYAYTDDCKNWCKNRLKSLRPLPKQEQSEVDLEKSLRNDLSKLFTGSDKQKPAESKEWITDETKQISPSLDIAASIKTSRIETLKNLLSYLKYERKSTQEEINISFIPCLENLLKYTENTNNYVEWSEYDEKMMNEIITIMDGGKVTSGTYLSEYAAWIKALPERFVLQPKQEWSEEDERIMNNCIEYIKASCLDANELYECIDWLESPRPQSQTVYKTAIESILELCRSCDIKKQFSVAAMDFWANVKVKCEEALQACPSLDEPSWKPSKEQMRALFDASERNDKLGFVLRNLYNDLKKL